jgi:antitoxin component YwqK of YwqJK toxin-antitoxin module
MRTLLVVLLVFLAAPWVRATVTPARPQLRFWPSGQVKEEVWSRLDVNGEWVDEGRYRSWYENGSRQLEGENHHGKPTGVWHGWYETGQDFVESRYTHGMGEFVWWYPSGKVLREGLRDENDVAQGRWTEWYPSGRKRMEGEFVNGERNGEWTFWTDENSPRVSHQTWRHGERIR